jgi:hypothetical protein
MLQVSRRRGLVEQPGFDIRPARLAEKATGQNQTVLLQVFPILLDFSFARGE